MQDREMDRQGITIIPFSKGSRTALGTPNKP